MNQPQNTEREVHMRHAVEYGRRRLDVSDEELLADLRAYAIQRVVPFGHDYLYGYYSVAHMDWSFVAIVLEPSVDDLVDSVITSKCGDGDLYTLPFRVVADWFFGLPERKKTVKRACSDSQWWDSYKYLGTAEFCDIASLGSDKFGFYTRRLSNNDVATMLTRGQRSKLARLRDGEPLDQREQIGQLYLMGLVTILGDELTERGSTIARYHL